MRHAIVFWLGAGLSSLLHAQPTPAPDLAATLSYQVIEQSRDGLTKTLSYRQHFIRVGNRLWWQRILPKSPLAVVDHDHSHSNEHQHRDLGLAARFLLQPTSGPLEASLVDVDQQLLVVLSPIEQRELGLSNWAEAYFLFEPDRLATMTSQPGPKPGLTRYRQQQDQTELELDWDTARQIPVRIAQRKQDGSRSSLMQLEFTPLPQPLPWQSLHQYQRKDYSDWLD